MGLGYAVDGSIAKFMYLGMDCETVIRYPVSNKEDSTYFLIIQKLNYSLHFKWIYRSLSSKCLFDIQNFINFKIERIL